MTKIMTTVYIDLELRDYCKQRGYHVSLLLENAIRAQKAKDEDPEETIRKANKMRQDAEEAQKNAFKIETLSMIKRAGLPLSAFWQREINKRIEEHPEIGTLEELIIIAKGENHVRNREPD